MISNMRIGIIHIAIGLLQGLALAALWPAFYGLMQTSAAFGGDNPFIVVPLALMLFFVPVTFNLGLGRLRPVALAGWAVTVALICGGAGLNAAYTGMSDLRSEVLGVISELMVVLLIGQSLLVAWQTRRTQGGAFYPACFDAAWRHALTLMLAAFLTGVFWAMLALGAMLFRSAGSDLLLHLIVAPYFWLPVTATAFACALYVADLSDELTRAARSLAVMSWFLPPLVVLAAGFLIVLAVNGLETLWQTQWIATTMLTGATLLIASLIVLINAAYRDGREDDRAPLVPRCASAAGAVLLMPLVALFGHALFTRVSQYGWTGGRVLAASVIGIAAGYAIGYLLAVLRSGLRMKQLEHTNIGVAFATAAVLLALNTPLLSPARLSVNSQIAWLRASPSIPPDFDFRYLAHESGRYGREALQQLIASPEGPQAAEIARRAASAARATNYSRRRGPELLAPEQRARNITVVPVDAVLAESFLRQEPARQSDWLPREILSSCFAEGASCHAVVLERERNGVSGILLISESDALLFTQGGTNAWRGVAHVENAGCPGLRAAMLAGDVRPAPLEHPHLAVAGVPLQLGFYDDSCPARR